MKFLLTFKMRVLVIILVFLVRQSLAVIYSLNESEYSRMPPLFALDDYPSCLSQPEGTYCLVDVNLHGESALWQIIKEYSAHTMKHFNHTQIHRGVCVTATCKGFIQNRSLERKEDLIVILEACINDSLWRNYELEGNVAEINYCKKANEDTQIDLSDVIVAVVYLVIILLNIVGSFYDILFFSDDGKGGNPHLLAFSVRRNWKKLTAASGGSDPRLDRLKVFHGLRTLTMVCVFFCHAMLVMTCSYVYNPLYFEKQYDELARQFLFNGNLVTYTFFVMSAFLLAFNFEMHAETHPVSWTQWPNGILQRWLRLTPTYALVLATTSTLMRHAGSGPQWDLLVVSEAEACRRFWWANVFYFNNYVYEAALCAPQSWYLAADTQLFCIGLLVCIISRTTRAKKIAVSILFLISILAPALHTYFQDLDALVIHSPETLRTLYANNRTFRLLFVRGHTNLSTYTLGLAGGFLAYYWLKQGKDFSTLKHYRLLLWLMVPTSVAVIFSGKIFYVDVPPSSTVRVAYAAVFKPVFQALIVFLIIGCVFKFESVYRGIVEWRGFTWTGRVTYSAFLLHMTFQRALVGIQQTPLHVTDYYVLMILAATIFLSYMCAGLLWVCVEAPANNLTKAAFARARRPQRKADSSLDLAK